MSLPDNQQLNYGYTYDKVDNITAKQTEHGDYGYQYDSLYRLTDADHPNQPDEAFDYDRVGNRIGSTDTAGPWTHNANNELEAYGNTTFQYDANGNMIEKNVGGTITRFFYNLEDRLERVEDGSGTVIATYYYDPFGRRLWKEVGGIRTCFDYSDEGLVGEYGATGTEIKTYGWKPGKTWSTDPLFMKAEAEYYWYHNDHLGTPQVMTTSSGAVVWSTKYTSFGIASVDAGSLVVNQLRFSGQYFDNETGFHYNWNRYYNPKIGRFLRLDPIGFNGGLNLYVYSKSNPLKNIDSSGLAYCVYSRFETFGTIACTFSNNDCNCKDPLVSSSFSGNGTELSEKKYGGPIPRGTWKIDAPGSIAKHPNWAYLQPVGHSAHGRTGFFIHGPGARNLGCISVRNGRERLMDCLKKDGGGELEVIDIGDSYMP